jgi:hypothetical protein
VETNDRNNRRHRALQIEGLKVKEEVEVETPFGKPSDK